MTKRISMYYEVKDYFDGHRFPTYSDMDKNISSYSLEMHESLKAMWRIFDHPDRSRRFENIQRKKIRDHGPDYLFAQFGNLVVALSLLNAPARIIQGFAKIMDSIFALEVN